METPGSVAPGAIPTVDFLLARRAAPVKKMRVKNQVCIWRMDAGVRYDLGSRWYPDCMAAAHTTNPAKPECLRDRWLDIEGRGAADGFRACELDPEPSINSGRWPTILEVRNWVLGSWQFGEVESARSTITNRKTKALGAGRLEHIRNDS
jgi:hypothetical protein